MAQGATKVQGSLQLAEGHARVVQTNTGKAVADRAKAVGDALEVVQTNTGKAVADRAKAVGEALEGGRRTVDGVVGGAVAGAAKAVGEKVDDVKKGIQANVSNTQAHLSNKLNDTKAKLSEHIGKTADKPAVRPVREIGLHSVQLGGERCGVSGGFT